MGLGAADLDALSLWQFGARVDGYNRAHSPEEDKALSDQEVDELSALLDA